MNIRIGIFSALVFLAFQTTAQQKVAVEDVVIRALESGYDVQLSRNALLSSQTDAKNAVGLFIPDLSLNGTRNFSDQDSRQTLANDSVVVRPGVKQNGLNGGIQLNWVLFDGLKMFATYKGLQQIAGVNEVLLKNQMANTMSSVIGSYYSIVAQEQQLKAINEQISVGEERIKLAERKLQVGAGAKTELLQARLDQNAFRTLAYSRRPRSFRQRPR
jgi:outer membrane protein TolC